MTCVVSEHSEQDADDQSSFGALLIAKVSRHLRADNKTADRSVCWAQVVRHISHVMIRLYILSQFLPDTGHTTNDILCRNKIPC